MISIKSLEEKKRYLNILVIKQEVIKDLRGKMKQCWDIVEHEYTGNAVVVQNLKGEIETEEKMKKIRGEDE